MLSSSHHEARVVLYDPALSCLLVGYVAIHECLSLFRLLNVVQCKHRHPLLLTFRVSSASNACRRSAQQLNPTHPLPSFSSTVLVRRAPHHGREAQYVTTLVKALSQRYPQSVYYTMRAFLLERREQGDRGSVASNPDSNKLPKAMSVRLPGGGTVSGGGVCGEWG